MTKFEFAGPEWIAALRELLNVYAKKVPPGIELSLCEIFTDVPGHLDRNGDRTIAWHCRIKDGRVHFEETAIAEADVHTKVDYAFILPIVRWVYTKDVMKDVNAYIAKGVAEGKLFSTGTGRAPREFLDMHNDMAARTL